MKKILLQIYLVIEYLVALAWFTIGTLICIFIVLTSESCRPGDTFPIFCSSSLLESVLTFTFPILFYIFTSYTFITSIKSTKKTNKKRTINSN